MSYKIQHMGIGGILDQAIAIIKNEFGLLFSIVLILIVPFALLNGFLTMSALSGLVEPSNPMLGTPAPTDLEYEPQVPGWYLPWVFFASILSIVLYSISNAAVIYAVAKRYLGQGVTALEAIRYAFGRFLPLIGTTILSGLAIMGGLILLIIPGLIFALWFMLAQHVVVIEEISGSKALGRSRKLVAPNWSTALVLMLVVMVISWALQAVAYLIPQPHLQLIVLNLLSAVLTIFATAAWVVFYFSCRSGVENFDLHYLAEQIDTEPTLATQPV